jgi:hypothetical protein
VSLDVRFQPSAWSYPDIRRARYAERELLKIKAEGHIILIITEADLNEVGSGANFFSMLRDLYEREHLDLQTNVKRRQQKRKQKNA